MKKWTLLLLLLMLYGVGMAQTKKLVGTVYNSSGIVPIVGCQVHNLNTGEYVFGDDNGRFIMSVSVNDSLVVSHSGYSQSLVVIDNRDYSRGRKDIILLATVSIPPTRDLNAMWLRLNFLILTKILMMFILRKKNGGMPLTPKKLLIY